jgi:RHS repeat-associated protein
VDLSFGYVGKLYDEVTKVNYYLNRWYDHRIGKWLSEDPLGFAGGDANLSRYVGNTSSMLTDPLGLAAFGSDGSANVTSESALQQEDESNPETIDPTLADVAILVKVHAAMRHDPERPQDEPNPELIAWILCKLPKGPGQDTNGAAPSREYFLARPVHRFTDPTDSSPTYPETREPGYLVLKNFGNRNPWSPIDPSGNPIPSIPESYFAPKPDYTGPTASDPDAKPPHAIRAMELFARKERIKEELWHPYHPHGHHHEETTRELQDNRPVRGWRPRTK